VADELNGYDSIPIEIDGSARRALPISCTFDAHDIDSFVAFLQTLDGVRVARTHANPCVQCEVTEGMKRPLTTLSRWTKTSDSPAQHAGDLRNVGTPRVLTRRGLQKTLA
jgi:hypothetical protein